MSGEERSDHSQEAKQVEVGIHMGQFTVATTEYRFYTGEIIK